MCDADDQAWRDSEGPDPDDCADDDSVEMQPCPECGHLVYEEAEKCPLCGQWINRHASSRGPWLVALAAMATIALLVATTC